MDYSNAPSTPAAPLTAPRKRIAIVGGGISGLAAAYTLAQSQAELELHLYESNPVLGGHAHTVDVEVDGINFAVDTGFLVYNERTYPGLIALFEDLGVEVAPAQMGFSVQIPARASGHTLRPRLEWAGNTLGSLFAQKRNLLRPRFWGMLKDIVRFNSLSTQLARKLLESPLSEQDKQAKHQAHLDSGTVGEFLQQHGLGAAFTEDYFLPMVACIWSCPPQQMLDFPIETMLRFCHNHGLLQINNRPQWFTVRGGSRNYVNKLAERLLQKGVTLHLAEPTQRILRQSDGVRITSASGEQHFDAVLLACHSDQALQLIETDASPAERSVLAAIRYQNNTAVLHTDSQLLPQSRQAWAAWNYEANADPSARVCLHYWLNDLQPLPTQIPIVVSLNPLRPPRSETVLRSLHYAHPIFDAQAIAAQSQVPSIQNAYLAGEKSALRSRTWFAGAWQRYGFHEDGYQSGVAAAHSMLCALSWPEAPFGGQTSR